MLLDDRSAAGPMTRCIDSDEINRPKPEKCFCLDPMKASARAEYLWAAQHRRMVHDAQHVPAERDLDVVFLGDSITEHMNGTRGMGQNTLPTFQAVFDKFFNLKTATAELEGMALGSSGDTCTELLWHLQNGVLDRLLQPKVFVVLIGTNDIGRMGCSKRNVLAGILHVAQLVHDQKPDSIILLHGLLPRSDHFNLVPVDYSLNMFWKDIMWINRELKRFCAVHPGEWFYMDASSVFLQKKRPTTAGEDTQGAFEINKELMTDALHPNEKGMELWLPVIVEQVKERIRAKKKGRQ